MQRIPKYRGQPGYISINGPIVTIRSSDARRENVPAPEPRVVDSEGNVDYEAEADEDSVKLWKKKIATYLLREGKWSGDQGGTEFYLSDFPSNYKLYLHQKGDKSDPRRDLYLYGSEYVTRFRSPEEFALHAKWLAFGQPLYDDGKPRCGCRYCRPSNTQTVITQYLKDRAGIITADGEGGTSTSKRRQRDDGVTEIYYKDYSHGGAVQIVRV